MCTNMVLFPKHTCNQGFYYRHYTFLCWEHLYMFYHHVLLWLMTQQSNEHNYKEQQPSLQKHPATSNQPPANQHVGETWARPLAQSKTTKPIFCSIGFSWAVAVDCRARWHEAARRLENPLKSGGPLRPRVCQTCA